MPIRVQRKRVKGWRMPENTLSVTRPGEFGNPFVIGGYYKIGNGKNGFSWLRCLDEVLAIKQGFTKINTATEAVEWFKRYIELYPLRENVIEKIRNKNLACWCKVGQPCHADVLLEIANK